jgi:hypothetical protein
MWGARFRSRPGVALVSAVARRTYFASGNNTRVVCGGGLVRESSHGGRVCRIGTCSTSCVTKS